MDWDQLIRRLHAVVRRHGGDGAFVLLFLAALLWGGGAALSGLVKFAGDLTPAMTAEAVAAPLPANRLALRGSIAPSAYAPQILFPVQSHAFPTWLTARASQPAMPPTPVLHPVIAICIDDLGEDIAGTDQAMALPKAVALSFLPYADTSAFLAVEAARKGHEILAHVPMEAIGPIDPGPMTLKVGAADNAARLTWNLARIPGIVGINNHEGSKFTADAASLAPVAQALAARHLFFFDSRTTASSQVVAVARSFGVASAGRDIFLDDDVTDAAITKQLNALVARARTQGVAIAIGHPHALTLKLLAVWLAQDHGVTLVPLDEAIRLKSEHAQLASR